MNEPREASGLSCTGLVKAYGGVTVVKSVDLAVRPGRVVGLIGENGAGKSTLSSMLTGVVQPDGGVNVPGVALVATSTRPSPAFAAVGTDTDSLVLNPVVDAAPTNAIPDDGGGSVGGADANDTAPW